MWYGVQNMSKYDIDIKVQPLTAGGKFSALVSGRPSAEAVLQCRVCLHRKLKHCYIVHYRVYMDTWITLLYFLIKDFQFL